MLPALYGDTGGDTELRELRGESESCDTEVAGKLRPEDAASPGPGWPP